MLIMNTKSQMRKEIRDTLISMSEPEYQKFTAGLLPGVDNLLGVRVPKLRKYARQVRKAYGLDYLEETLSRTDMDNDDIEYMEEIFIQGMVIGSLKVKEDISLIRIQDYIEKYIPKINNWSTCDVFCAGLKITKEYPAEMWDFLKPYLISDSAYDVRFGIVMIINYYIQNEYIDELYNIFNEIGKSWNNKPQSEQGVYYVKMALAWAVSICYVEYPEKTFGYLEEMKDKGFILDDFTYNKSLQKIVESRCVSAEVKERIKAMKRK